MLSLMFIKDLNCKIMVIGIKKAVKSMAILFAGRWWSATGGVAKTIG